MSRKITEYFKSSKTKFINIKSGAPFDVYIGRAFGEFKASKWGNHFKVKDCGSNEEACRRYEKYIKRNPEILKSLNELKGKTLGCWCKPKMCHGEILIKLINTHNF